MKSRDWDNLHFHWWSTELDWHYDEMWNMPMRMKGKLGIYVIYLPVENEPAQVLYVGQGLVRNRCVNIHNGVDSRFNQDLRWMELDKYELRVAWAEENDVAVRRGVEAYLAKELRPLAGRVWHNDFPIAVNLPNFKG